MKKVLLAGIIVVVSSTYNLFAQKNIVEKIKPKQVLEIESLFPMFFNGGFHVGAGYRYENWRIRISVINGGRYDAENAGINNSSDNFKRYYKTSPGIFVGYNIWKHLEKFGNIWIY